MTCREKAKEVYAHRGGKPTRRKKKKEEHPNPWVTRTRNDGTFSYRIDRNHPLIKALTDGVPPEHMNELDTLLRLIEESLPIQRIWIDTADNRDVSHPFEGDKNTEVKKHLKVCHAALASIRQSSEEAWDELAAFRLFRPRMLSR